MNVCECREGSSTIHFYNLVQHFLDYKVLPFQRLFKQKKNRSGVFCVLFCMGKLQDICQNDTICDEESNNTFKTLKYHKTTQTSHSFSVSGLAFKAKSIAPEGPYWLAYQIVKAYHIWVSWTQVSDSPGARLQQHFCPAMVSHQRTPSCIIKSLKTAIITPRNANIKNWQPQYLEV